MMLEPPPAIIEVVHDTGGTMGERMAVMAWLRRTGARVRIRYCGSACYMLLALPKWQVCVYPDAWFAYHTNIGQRNDTLKWERGSDVIRRGMAVACTRHERKIK